MEQSLKEQVALLIEWMEEKKAENIKTYDVQSKNDYTDYIIVCEGSGDLHNRAIADNIAAQAKENKMYVLGKEGYSNGTWILLDLVNIVVHIFDPETRGFYDIEKIWQASKELRKHTQTSENPGGSNVEG